MTAMKISSAASRTTRRSSGWMILFCPAAATPSPHRYHAQNQNGHSDKTLAAKGKKVDAGRAWVFGQSDQNLEAEV